MCLANASDPLGLTYVDAKNSSLPCTKDASDPQSTAAVYSKRARVRVRVRAASRRPAACPPAHRCSPAWPRAVLLLFYTFAGVGIVADAFMDAITIITSVGKWHARVDPATGLQNSVHIKRWNPTVANLTLMALGSSAPEIMLSIIEIVAGDYYSGQLGPSTIVGSAAFNMLVILAVCVSAPEVGEVRKIRDYNVFAITAFCSVFAYVWLLGVLTVHGEGIVDVAEGTCSFLFFPAMVGVAYLADTGFFGKTSHTQGSFITSVGEDTTGDGMADTAFQFSAFEAGKILDSIDTAGALHHEQMAHISAPRLSLSCLRHMSPVSHLTPHSTRTHVSRALIRPCSCRKNSRRTRDASLPRTASGKRWQDTRRLSKGGCSGNDRKVEERSYHIAAPRRSCDRSAGRGADRFRVHAVLLQGVTGHSGGRCGPSG